MLEEGGLPFPDPTLPLEESIGEEGMGSTSFSNATVAFTHDGWRPLATAPRDRFKERVPGKSRNLVLLGLPVSQPCMNSQLEQKEEPWMLEGESLGSSCPDWKILSKESPPEQNISEKSFQDASVELSTVESNNRNNEFGKSLNLRPVLSPQQRVPTELLRLEETGLLLRRGLCQVVCGPVSMTSLSD
ncbi:zinc finger protein 79 isoform X5 [Choloepus didactylus]|uniref:zinc finger protein 79 isoform X5 n=1 Tax=Choloepus didactylus TaxID=27675 RepID=UPI00189F616A|nr:zinc finger protein 79 isoform X5 [Choloepus didactylus]